MDWQTKEGISLSDNDPAICEWGTHTNPDVDYARPIKNSPVTRGFDYYYGISASLDMPPYTYIENDRVCRMPERICNGESGKRFYRSGPVAPGFRHERVTPELTDKACAYIKEKAAGDSPFFLYFPLPSPHSPIMPEEFAGRSGTNEYGDFCLMVDDCVGKIMRTLEESGIAEDTILVFTSDNGCSPTANFDELAKVGHNPSYVFRGHKADIYEGGHRIPLIVRWPARIRPGSVSSQTSCLSDLLATVADILDEKLPDNAGEDSISNLPLWLEKQDKDKPLREATVHHSMNGSFSIRQGRWKLEFCPGSGGWSFPVPGKDDAGLPPIQLYDLESDIRECSNIHDKYPEIIDRLTKLMTKYVKDGRSTPGAAQKNTGPAYWPQLNWMLES
jgi:arylsulfatase A